MIWLLFGCFYLCPTLADSLVLHEKRDTAWDSHFPRRRMSPDILLPMRIGLTQNSHALRNAESWLMDVSDPSSENYGRHWSQEDVIKAFQPSDHTLANVTLWLQGHGISEFTHSDNKLWFAFDLPAGRAESILKTTYFEHESTKGTLVASCDSYYLPSYLSPHVDYITPGIKESAFAHSATSPTQSKRTQQLRQSAPGRQLRKISREATNIALPPFADSTSLEHCSREVTPACIRALYNFSVADPNLAVSPNNALGIYEEEDQYYYQGDLDDFYRYIAPNIPQGTSPNFVPLDGSVYPPTSANISRYLSYDGAETQLDLQIALPIVYPQNVSVLELEKTDSLRSETNALYTFLDVIDGSFCTQSQRVNSSRGRLPQCGVLAPPNVISTSWYKPETEFSLAYKIRQCNEYLKLGLQGVSLFFCSGDDGVWKEFNLLNTTRLDCKNSTGPPQFGPSWPSGCPWVTSVAATQVPSNRTVYEQEVAAEWTVPSNPKIGSASGGGFSLTYNLPSYQRDAILDYFYKHDPPWPYYLDGKWNSSCGKYNRNGRGFPDLSAVGTAIATMWAGGYDAMYGTSASAPLVAALFNRIIEERIRAAKGRIGFVNPALYKHPEILNDAIKGENGHIELDQGFQAVPGWDPVTGLGTPNYPKMLDLFMKLP